MMASTPSLGPWHAPEELKAVEVHVKKRLVDLERVPADGTSEDMEASRQKRLPQMGMPARVQAVDELAFELRLTRGARDDVSFLNRHGRSASDARGPGLGPHGRLLEAQEQLPAADLHQAGAVRRAVAEEVF